MRTFDMLLLAFDHCRNGSAMASSAELAYNEALHAYNASFSSLDGREQEKRARQWAFQSLAYSVGVFHEDCARVGKAIGHKCFASSQHPKDAKFFTESKHTRDHNPCVDTGCLNR